CGFLSNYKERKLLQTEEYQRTISKAIVNGVINYFS
ncbi:MAG: N-acetylmuramoyl-L-alanine amidase, partial [Bacilli bacterium]|nr:N-acetylmuramoyl-L-alanine amidase [Bacilli bacterium]